MSGSKFVSAYTMKYRYTNYRNNLKFLFINGEFRDFLPEELVWKKRGTPLPSSVTIRPGAKYQGSQHTSTEGDVCFGDAGGSVWKLWSFKESNYG